MAKAAAASPALNPVIVIAGPELYLRNEHLAAIKATLFGKDDPGMGLVRIDAKALGGAAITAILDECRMPSMFAPQKLVIVEPADMLFKKGGGGGGDDDAGDDTGDSGRNRELLENYIESPTETATLVLVCTNWLKTTRVHKQLDKLGAVKWCDPIKDAQAPAWITKRARDAHNKQIEPVAAQRLAELIGPDLQRLDNELAKLSLYEPDAPVINVKAVDDLVGFQHEQQIWDMINALAARDAKTALKKIDELWALDPKIEYTVSGAIFVWLGQVLKARELVDRRMNDGMITKELKLWPPERAAKVLTLARAWGLAGAARWSQEMLAMDVANKSGLGEPRRNLERFIMTLCET